MITTIKKQLLATEPIKRSTFYKVIESLNQDYPLFRCQPLNIDQPTETVLLVEFVIQGDYTEDELELFMILIKRKLEEQFIGGRLT